MRTRPTEPTIEVIIARFAEQGWDDSTICGLLENFLQTRRHYWPDWNPFEKDLDSFLRNIANEENKWAFWTEQTGETKE